MTLFFFFFLEFENETALSYLHSDLGNVTIALGFLRYLAHLMNLLDTSFSL